MVAVYIAAKPLNTTFISIYKDILRNILGCMMEQKKTGTTTIVVKCKDGIVLAADRRATAGNIIAHGDYPKIYELTDKMLLTVAGTVSDIQLLIKIAKAQIGLMKVRTGREVTNKEAANLLAGLVYSNIRKFSLIPGVSQFLLAGIDKEGFNVYEINFDGSIMSIEEYVASGSGSDMVYGVLETLYKKDASVDDGVKLAVKGLNAAIQRDTASGSGFDVVTLTKEGIKRIATKKLQVKVEL